MKSEFNPSHKTAVSQINAALEKTAKPVKKSIPKTNRRADKSRISSEARRENQEKQPCRQDQRKMMEALQENMNKSAFAQQTMGGVAKLLAGSNPNMTREQMGYYLNASANLIGKQDWVGAGMLDRQIAQDGAKDLQGQADSVKPQPPRPVVSDIARMFWEINPKMKPEQIKDTLQIMAKYQSSPLWKALGETNN